MIMSSITVGSMEKIQQEVDDDDNDDNNDDDDNDDDNDDNDNDDDDDDDDVFHHSRKCGKDPTRSHPGGSKNHLNTHPQSKI